MHSKQLFHRLGKLGINEGQMSMESTSKEVFVLVDNLNVQIEN